MADEKSPGWSKRVGHDFARGHKEATGGIITSEEFEILCEVMEIGVKPDEGSTKKIDRGQKNNLDGFFGVQKKEKATVSDPLSGSQE